MLVGGRRGFLLLPDRSRFFPRLPLPGIFFLELCLSDPGPVARLEELKRDVNVPAVVFERLTDGAKPMTLPEIAREWKVPRGAFVSWFTTAHRAAYDSALKVLTDGMVFESLRVADEVAEDKDAIAKAKLRIDTMLRTAARWDRERYGEREPAGVTVTVNLGDQAKEILALEERLGLGVKNSPALPALPAEIVIAEPI